MVWLVETDVGGVVPIRASRICTPKDVGVTTPNAVKIKDGRGNVLWSRD